MLNLDMMEVYKTRGKLENAQLWYLFYNRQMMEHHICDAVCEHASFHDTQLMAACLH